MALRRGRWGAALRSGGNGRSTNEGKMGHVGCGIAEGRLGVAPRKG